MLKVALIGNMNNNFFSVMRYFVDLSIDAHLYLFEDEISGSMSHFRPECDTWSINKWKDRIHILPVGRLYPWCFRNPITLKGHGSKRSLRQIFRNYDITIGSGMTPSMFHHIGLKLSLFVPYSVGIEYYRNSEVINIRRGSNLVKKIMCHLVTRKQSKGIKETVLCYNSDLGITKDSFNSLNKEFLNLSIPMVYNGDNPKEVNLRESLVQSKNRIKDSDFSVFSHSRHMWAKKSIKNTFDTKNNDWLIRAFAKFIRHSEVNAVLAIVEYGPDIGETKKLSEELGISEKVIFLPMMDRKEIMYFLSICDIGVGEFCNKSVKMWGGTGWEVLSSGKPLLQSFHYTKEEYLNEFEHEAPPICVVNSEQDVLNHLTNLSENKAERDLIGNKSKEWFNKNNGIGLARKWLKEIINKEILEQI